MNYTGCCFLNDNRDIRDNLWYTEIQHLNSRWAFSALLKINPCVAKDWQGLLNGSNVTNANVFHLYKSWTSPY